MGRSASGQKLVKRRENKTWDNGNLEVFSGGGGGIGKGDNKIFLTSMKL